jgi:hypothetical protein
MLSITYFISRHRAVQVVAQELRYRADLCHFFSPEGQLAPGRAFLIFLIAREDGWDTVAG